MNINEMKRLAGVSLEDGQALTLLDEAVEISHEATYEDLGKMFDAAKRAITFASKLKDPKQRQKHFGKIGAGMKKIMAHLEKHADK